MGGEFAFGPVRDCASGRIKDQDTRDGTCRRFQQLGPIAIGFGVNGLNMNAAFGVAGYLDWIAVVAEELLLAVGEDFYFAHVAGGGEGLTADDANGCGGWGCGVLCRCLTGDESDEAR